MVRGQRAPPPTEGKGSRIQDFTGLLWVKPLFLMIACPRVSRPPPPGPFLPVSPLSSYPCPTPYKIIILGDKMIPQ